MRFDGLGLYLGKSNIYTASGQILFLRRPARQANGAGFVPFLYIHEFETMLWMGASFDAFNPKGLIRAGIHFTVPTGRYTRTQRT